MVGDGAVGDDKRALRARMRAVRAAIGAEPADRARRSTAICSAVVDAIALRSPRHVLLYDALPGEPDLSDVAAWCAANDVATSRPIVDGDALVIDPGNLDPRHLDVVVVPGLAFSRSGARLGQGGGHFDRFLTQLRRDCLRIGVAFRDQLVEALPTEHHDVAVDLVITD